MDIIFVNYFIMGPMTHDVLLQYYCEAPGSATNPSTGALFQTCSPPAVRAVSSFPCGTERRLLAVVESY